MVSLLFLCLSPVCQANSQQLLVLFFLSFTNRVYSFFYILQNHICTHTLMMTMCTTWHMIFILEVMAWWWRVVVIWLVTFIFYAENFVNCVFMGSSKLLYLHNFFLITAHHVTISLSLAPSAVCVWVFSWMDRFSFHHIIHHISQNSLSHILSNPI